MRKNLKRLRVIAEARQTLDTQQFAVAIVNWVVTRWTAAQQETTEPTADVPDTEAAK